MCSSDLSLFGASEGPFSCLYCSTSSVPTFPGSAQHTQCLLRASVLTGWGRANLPSPVNPSWTDWQERGLLTDHIWFGHLFPKSRAPAHPALGQRIPLLLWEAFQACSPLGPFQLCSICLGNSCHSPSCPSLGSALVLPPPLHRSSHLSAPFPSSLFGIWPSATASCLAPSWQPLLWLSQACQCTVCGISSPVQVRRAMPHARLWLPGPAQLMGASSLIPPDR